MCASAPIPSRVCPPLYQLAQGALARLSSYPATAVVVVIASAFAATRRPPRLTDRSHRYPYAFTSSPLSSRLCSACSSPRFLSPSQASVPGPFRVRAGPSESGLYPYPRLAAHFARGSPRSHARFPPCPPYICSFSLSHPLSLSRTSSPRLLSRTHARMIAWHERIVPTNDVSPEPKDAASSIPSPIFSYHHHYHLHLCTSRLSGSLKTHTLSSIVLSPLIGC